jgi:hypothetical protein
LGELLAFLHSLEEDGPAAAICRFFWVHFESPDCHANDTLHWNDTVESKAGSDKCQIVAGLQSTAAAFRRAAVSYCWTLL